MGIRLDKPFQLLIEENVEKLSGNLGVFELADEKGTVVYIGYAGGRSLFGLKGELAACREQTSGTQFRVEINTAYLTRYQELLMIHKADFGNLPIENSESDGNNLGRLSPG